MRSRGLLVLVLLVILGAVGTIRLAVSMTKREPPAPSERSNLANWFFVALVAFALRFGIPYCEGRWSVWWFPIDLLPPFVLLVSFVILCAFFIHALAAGRHRIAATMRLLCFLLLLIPVVIVSPVSLSALGFQQYARTVLTVDEWREITHFARAHIEPGGRLTGPGKTFWNEKDRPLWSAFTAATQIKKLNPALTITVYPNSTVLEWGATLVGYRDVEVLTTESGIHPNAPKSRPGAPKPRFIAEDIYTLVD